VSKILLTGSYSLFVKYISDKYTTFTLFVLCSAVCTTGQAQEI